MSKRKCYRQTLDCIELTLFLTQNQEFRFFTTHSELLIYVWNVFVIWQNIHIFISKFLMIFPICILFIVVFDCSNILSFCFRWGMPPALWIRLNVFIIFFVRKEPSFLPNHPPGTLLGWYFDLQLCSIVIPCIFLAYVELWITFILTLVILLLILKHKICLYISSQH